MRGAQNLKTSVGSRGAFKQWVLRALGSPVINIELADEQLEDAIDDAIQFMQDWHSDTQIRVYRKWAITQEIIDSNKATMSSEDQDSDGSEQDALGIPVPDNVVGVSKVFYLPSSLRSGSLFNAQYMFWINNFDFFFGPSGGGSSGMTNIVATKNYMADIEFLTNVLPIMSFNNYRGKVYVNTNWDRLMPGDYLILECYILNNYNENPSVWNDRYFKKLSTAYAKQRWGSNLSKYNNFQLPGGLTIDGKAISDDAKAEIENIEKSIKEQSAQDLNQIFIG